MGAEYDGIDEGVGVFAGVGWEYFLNPHIALNLSLIWKSIKWNRKDYYYYYGYYDTKTTFIRSELGFRIFF